MLKTKCDVKCKGSSTVSLTGYQKIFDGARIYRHVIAPSNKPLTSDPQVVLVSWCSFSIIHIASPIILPRPKHYPDVTETAMGQEGSNVDGGILKCDHVNELLKIHVDIILADHPYKNNDAFLIFFSVRHMHCIETQH